MKGSFDSFKRSPPIGCIRTLSPQNTVLPPGYQPSSKFLPQHLHQAKNLRTLGSTQPQMRTLVVKLTTQLSLKQSAYGYHYLPAGSSPASEEEPKLGALKACLSGPLVCSWLSDFLFFFNQGQLLHHTEVGAQGGDEGWEDDKDSSPPQHPIGSQSKWVAGR